MRLLLITTLFLISFANNASAQLGGPGVAEAAAGNGGYRGTNSQQAPAPRQAVPLSPSQFNFVDRVYLLFNKSKTSIAANQLGAAIRLENMISKNSEASQWLARGRSGDVRGFRHGIDFINMMEKSGVARSEAGEILNQRATNQQQITTLLAVKIMSAQYGRDWLPELQQAWNSYVSSRKRRGLSASRTDAAWEGRKNELARSFGYPDCSSLVWTHSLVAAVSAASNQFFNDPELRKAQQGGFVFVLDNFAIYPNPSPSKTQVRLDIRMSVRTANIPAEVANVLYNMQQSADGGWKVVGVSPAQ